MRSLISILVASVVLASTLACDTSGGDTVQYRSPDGVYTVQLVGSRSAPKLPFIEHTLRAKVSKGSEVQVNDWPIHFADWMDTAFDDEYSSVSWLTERILRAQSAGARLRKDPEDVITIENNSGRALRLLTIKAADLFVIVDVPAGWKTQVNATPQSQTTDLSWIEAGGVWADSTTLSKTGVNFQLPKGVQGAFRYTVDVQPATVQIRETQHGAKPWSPR